MSGEPVTVVRGARDSLLVAVPPAWLSLELDDTDNNPRTGERPETGRQVIERLPRVVALLDGPMFDPEGEYPSYTRARMLYRYLDRRRGISVPSQFPTRGATLSMAGDARAVVMDGAAEIEGAVFAVQGYPAVLRRRSNVATRDKNRETTGRAALCLLGDGRVAFAVGRAPMWEFGEALRALTDVDVVDALYTDGGGSTTLALRDANGTLEVAHGLDSRRLPAYILAEPGPSSPGMVGSPAEGSPWWKTVAVGTLAVAVGLGALWWLEDQA